MPVHTVGRYKFPPRDALVNFKGKQLLYVFWDKHLLFGRPFALALHPDTPFSQVVDEHVAQAYNLHPDFARIDWTNVAWIKSGAAWKPDRDKSLAENGLRHKDLIRLVTPGLDGLDGLGG
jgi:phenol/toluene 2-monooxygenase (NADH) P4/A4